MKVKLLIFAQIDVGEEIFDLLVLGKGLVCLGVELFEHVVKLFEIEVASSRVVPLYSYRSTLRKASLGEIM